MPNQSQINFDDFKLENITDPNYNPKGVVEKPEDEGTDANIAPVVNEDNEPIVEPQKGKKVSQKDSNEVVGRSKQPKEQPTKHVIPAEEVDEDPLGDEDNEDESIPEETPALDLKPFYDLFHEKLGWEVDEAEMPENSIEGLIGYMDKITTEASRPKYSSELSEQFDKYLANGGQPKKFMETMFGTRDYSTVTLESDADKKQVLHEYLSRTNPEKDSDWRNRKIARYEDSGVLDDEANDALDEQKAYDAKNKANIAVEQERQRQEQEKQYREQLEDLKKTITNKKDIAGIPVNPKEMGSFYEFLTAPGKDGYTAYEKTLQNDKEAIIKMAYLAYKGFDVNNLKTNVRSDVVKDVKKALSRFSSSKDGLESRTGLPAKSNKMNFKDFDLGL